MKKLLAHPLWVLFFAVVVVAIAQPANAPALAVPLTATDRENIIATLHKYAAAQTLWSEYYAVNNVQRAYFAGLRDGLQMSASYVEVYQTP